MASIAIRIPDELKKEMVKIHINWSEYLRESIRHALDSERKRAGFQAIRRLIKSKPVAKGTAARLVRQIRDHG